MQRCLFALIVIFAFVIRIISLDTLPPSLNWDEVSHGYNAYSILKTGKDEWGVQFPSIFQAYGDFKLPVYIYITAFIESLLGLNAFAVRLPSALAGIGSVVFTYLLVQKLFKDKTVALLSSLLVAIEPWSLFLSRIAVEANLALFFVISGVYFTLLGLDKKKWSFVFGLALLGLSAWTYNSARLVVPLLLVSMLVIYRGTVVKLLNKPSLVLASVIVATIFFLPMFFQLINPEGVARYGWVRILDEGAIASIEEQRNTSDLSPLVERLIFNKPLYFTKEFAVNYISHFTPSFLFFNGGDHHQFNVPGHGLLYLVNLPFFYFGAYLLIKNSRKKPYQLLLAWLLLAPIASSLTREAPHTLRAILMIPVPMILTSLSIREILAKKKLLIIYAIVITTLFVNYIIKYIDYSKQYSQAWQYGNQQAVDYVINNYDKYESIIMTKKYGEPHEFVLFYSQWDPEKYQNDTNLVRFSQSNWYWVDRFDKFFFVNDWEMPQDGTQFVTESDLQLTCLNTKCLLVTSPNNSPTGWQKIEQINFLNGEIAFEIYEN